MWNASVTGVLDEIGNAVNTTGSKLLATANSPGLASGMAIIAVTGLTFLLISGLFTLEVQKGLRPNVQPSWGGLQKLPLSIFGCAYAPLVLQWMHW
jgi:hypothetical protein